MEVVVRHLGGKKKRRQASNNETGGLHGPAKRNRNIALSVRDATKILAHVAFVLVQARLCKGINAEQASFDDGRDHQHLE